MFKEILKAFEKIESNATFRRPMLENVDISQIRYVRPVSMYNELVLRDDAGKTIVRFEGDDRMQLFRQVEKEIEAITDEHGQRYVLSPAQMGEYVVFDLSKVDRIASFVSPFREKNGVLLLDAQGHAVDSVYDGSFEGHLKAIEPVLNKRRRQATKHVSPSVVEKPSKVLIAGHVIDLADVVSFRPWLMSKGIVVEGHKTNILKNTVCDYEVESKKLEAALNKYLGY